MESFSEDLQSSDIDNKIFSVLDSEKEALMKFEIEKSAECRYICNR